MRDFKNTTPRPWKVYKNPIVGLTIIGQDGDFFVLECAFGGRKTNLANAAIIIAAVNAYDPEREAKVQALVEAAKEARVLIGASNEFLTPPVVEANLNQAWHKLTDALTALEKMS